jgi:3-methyladenine DNA glycosylase AlkD
MTLEAEDLATEIGDRLAQSSQLNTASIRSLRREYSRRLAQAAPELIIKVALRLVRDGDLIKRFFAYELVQHHKQAIQRLDEKMIEQLGRGINSWSAVDCFACYLAGLAWREKRIDDAVVKRWTRSRDRWWRRSALVSTVPLNNKARGGKGDTAPTLEICRMLMTDRDDMVVKALSWALRELAKRDPKSVQEFLHDHKDVLASRVFREVSNKLTTGLKNPRKRQRFSRLQG